MNMEMANNKERLREEYVRIFILICLCFRLKINGVENVISYTPATLVFDLFIEQQLPEKFEAPTQLRKT